MINIHEKTIQDLEFLTVLEQTSLHCITTLGKENALTILPFSNKEQLLNELQLTNDYVSSFYNDNRIPNHGFDEITKELKLLKIENTFLEPLSFKKIVSISMTSNEIVKFFNKFEEYYPTLKEFSQKIEVTKAIVERIDAVINRFDEVKDDASPLL